MTLHGPEKIDPIQLSIERLELNLRKLKKATQDPTSLWETAGHIWSAAYWIGELTKHPDILNHVCELRDALSHVVAQQQVKDIRHFEETVNQIITCYKQLNKTS
jgi:hypothetical protein